MTRDDKFKLVEKFIIENQHAYYRLAFSYVKNKENALDIVQESILKALRSIDRVDEVKYMKTWFYRIIVNTAIDFIRKHQRMSIMDDEILESHLPSLEDDVTDFDLQEAVDHLSPNYKTIIILRFFEDLKIEEIAEVTGDNINTVKTRLYAALRKLRIEMGEEQVYEQNG
ncbi:RNA polymerase sigma factor [Sporosarcina thermotolerans]|uniref:RNA polymerase sigma factor n=1 Tax=Sporosarcina thermotolerans TaxID=633404 RepID=A0AAW9AC81_9BACL|nr:RNA polymerase sigma factor [Sporosarcina thermotolerans]MDW0117975.1 RNA polymerase sigma factor [Sporosarcina thermotolerans]WHT49053.1 RNA polymerase sigma factor [Sporosarcina thermotolerans]